MKTIAQQLNIKDFPFIIKDKNGGVIYREISNGNWAKQKFDSHGRTLYFENSMGRWYKQEYDSEGKEIYYTDSEGNVEDNRSKLQELTLEEIAGILDIPVELLRIKE